MRGTSSPCCGRVGQAVVHQHVGALLAAHGVPLVGSDGEFLGAGGMQPSVPCSARCASSSATGRALARAVSYHESNIFRKAHCVHL